MPLDLVGMSHWNILLVTSGLGHFVSFQDIKIITFNDKGVPATWCHINHVGKKLLHYDSPGVI